eukprot:1155748-Pelagomonas_calceolata.AAC.1
MKTYGFASGCCMHSLLPWRNPCHPNVESERLQLQRAFSDIILKTMTLLQVAVCTPCCPGAALALQQEE